MSGATADLLHTLRGYILTCRGTLNVKVTLHSLYVEKSCPLDTLVVDKEKSVAFNAFLVMVVAIVISLFLCCVGAPLT